MWANFTAFRENRNQMLVLEPWEEPSGAAPGGRTRPCTQRTTELISGGRVRMDYRVSSNVAGLGGRTDGGQEVGAR